MESRRVSFVAHMFEGGIWGVDRVEEFDEVCRINDASSPRPLSSIHSSPEKFGPHQLLCYIYPQTAP